MEESTARLIFFAIIGVEAVAWIIAAQVSLSVMRDEEGNVVGGSIEAEGDPAALSDAIAVALASGGQMMQMVIQGFKLTERSAERIAFERAMPGMLSGPPQAVIDSGLVTFERLASGKVRVSYAAKVERLSKVTRWVLLPLLAAGLAALAAMAVVMWVYVIPSEKEGVRGQVFQTFQAVHLLWPPWLFLGIRRRGRRLAKSYLETVVSNAAILGGGSASAG